MALVLSHCHPFCLLAAQFSHCSNSLNLIWCIIMAKFIFDSLCKHPVDNIQYHKKCYDIVSSGHCSLHTVPSLVSARGWGGGHGRVAALAPGTRLLCTDQVAITRRSTPGRTPPRAPRRTRSAQPRPRPGRRRHWAAARGPSYFIVSVCAGGYHFPPVT